MTPSTTSTAVGTPAAERSPSFFVIGAFDQPSYSFSKWAGRGVNTIIDFDSLSGTVSFADWHAALVQSHLYAIRQPVGDLAQDATDPNLLAWMQPDEPEANGQQGEVQANYQAWHAAAPNMPIWLNFSGGDLATEGQADLAPYLQSTDWVSDDIFPVTGWGQPGAIDLSQTGDWIGGVLNTFESWSGGKPQFQIIETSNQQLSWINNPRGVTRDEFRGEVWDSVIHGVKGVIYFPQSFGGGFSYDATPDDVVAEMTSVDAQLEQWSSVLLAPGSMTSVPSPFEQAVRVFDGHTYFITLNMSHSSATLNGQTYSPYQVTIQEPNAGAAVSSNSRAKSKATPSRKIKPTHRPRRHAASGRTKRRVKHGTTQVKHSRR